MLCDKVVFQELHATLRVIREKNTHLEKSLSAENRLKQKLFYALNEARGQMADFQRQFVIYNNFCS